MNLPWLACAVALSILAGQAEGHARLVSTVPAAEAVLSGAPAEIRLVFDEAVVPALAGITITEAESDQQWTGPASAVAGDDTQFVVALPEALMPGRFLVHWHVVSADMHKVEGDFSFEVTP